MSDFLAGSFLAHEGLNEGEMFKIGRIHNRPLGSMESKEPDLFFSIIPKYVLDKEMEFLMAFQMGKQAARGICGRSDVDTEYGGDTVGVFEWKPPGIGWLMLNTDACFSNMGTGYGFVLRDHQDCVRQSGIGSLPTAISVEHAQTLAIWKSILQVQECWNTPIEIMTYCQKIVMHFHQSEDNLTVLGRIMNGLKQVLRLLQLCSLNFTNRKLNSIVHGICYM